MSVSSNSNEPKINIIPLMDVIFIFIFFLLMSVQFFEYFEIASSNPITKNAQATPPDSKEQKQFKLQLGKEKVEFTQGVDEKVVESFGYDKEGLSRLKEFMRKIKTENPDENSMIIKPYKDIDFNRIVSVVDSVQQRMSAGKDAKGNAKMKLLFRNIAFETRE